ncbi:MAG: PDZ domain-containing protein [Pirellulaceae bacterium]
MVNGKQMRFALAAILVVAAPLMLSADEPVRIYRVQVQPAPTKVLQPKHIQFEPAQSIESQPLRVLTFATRSQAAAKIGKYWIGVSLEPAEAALRAQLGLDGGLVVTDVGKEQPAEKAGLEKNDVLLRFGDKKLHEVNELVDAIDASAGKTTTVLLLRRGKEIKIDVTPIERPKSLTGAAEPENQQLQEPLTGPIDKLLGDRFQMQDGALRIWRMGPGIVFDSPHAKLPDGVTVTVTKQGDKEAQVTVQRGDDRWQATEKTLDELPADLREPVKRFLGRSPVPYRMAIPPAVRTPRSVQPTPPPAPRGEVQLRLRDLRIDDGQVQKQLAEMMKQLKEIREQTQRDGAFDKMREELNALRRDVDKLRQQHDD